MITILNIIGIYLLIGVTFTTVLLLAFRTIGYIEGYADGYSGREKEPPKSKPMTMAEKLKWYAISVVTWPYSSFVYVMELWAEIRKIVDKYKEGTP